MCTATTADPGTRVGIGATDIFGTIIGMAIATIDGELSKESGDPSTTLSLFFLTGFRLNGLALHQIYSSFIGTNRHEA